MTLRVLFAVSECYPLVKTGGLADVAGALPGALAAHGCEVKVLLPAYPQVRDALGDDATVVANLTRAGISARLLAATPAPGLQVLALDMPAYFDRPGTPYQDANGKDWPDNHLRFAALSFAATEVAMGRAGSWQPDVVHAHDWQGGLAPAYLALEGGARPATVFTIHNLAYQGVFDKSVLEALALPSASFAIDGVEFHGHISLLKAGLQYADHITTVSPSYAREIRSSEFGHGLDGLLVQRSAAVSGILNGIDETTWDPRTDPHIERNYDVATLDAKAVNKRALQAEFGLEQSPDAPLFCVVSRLTEQKGLDLLLAALPRLIERGGQLALLGAGDPALEAAFEDRHRLRPDRVGVHIGYDEALSHRLQAGADAILVPSRFEPCGLTQLYGLRYGTLPIVARTGGLADTVIDANTMALRDQVATGLQFSPVTVDALHGAIERALALYVDRDAWLTMQRRAMRQRVGWEEPAARYRKLYTDLVAARSSGQERAHLRP